jgi:hypothetical protein
VSSGWSHMDPDVPEFSIHRMRIKMVVKGGCSGWSHEDPVVPALSGQSVDWLVSSGWSHMDPDVPGLSIHRMHIQDGCFRAGPMRIQLSQNCQSTKVVSSSCVTQDGCVSRWLCSGWSHEDPVDPELIRCWFRCSFASC